MNLVKQASQAIVAKRGRGGDSELLAEFVLNRYPNKHTQRAVITDLKQLQDYLSQTFGIDLFQVKAFEIGLFRKNLEDLNYSIPSINRKLASIKSFYRFLFEVGKLDFNPAEYLKLIKFNRRVGKTNHFEDSELKSILNSFDEDKIIGLRNKVFLMIMFFTAARVTAICNLRFEDVLQDVTGIRIRLSEKRGEERILHLNSAVVPKFMYFLESLPYSDGYIFRTMRNKFFTNNQINQCDVFNFIRNASKKIGLEKKVSAHSFRATFATKWLSNKWNIDELQKITGHKSFDRLKLNDRNSLEASKSSLEKMQI